MKLSTYSVINSIFVLSAFAVGCSNDFNKGELKSIRSPANIVTATLDKDGNYVASFNSSGQSSQMMQIKSGDLSGASILLPPGSLSIPISITIGQGSSLTIPAVTSQLGLDGGSTSAAGPSVTFKPSESLGASSSFTLSIPISSSSSLSLDNFFPKSSDNFVVIFQTVSLEGDDKTYSVGVIPRQRLTVTSRSVSFQASALGTYQLVNTTAKVDNKIQKPSEEAPALKSELNVLISKIVPLIAKPGQTVQLTGTGFDKSGAQLAVNIPTSNGVRNLAIVTPVNSTTASFTMPSGSGLGLRSLVFLINDARASEHMFIADTAANTLSFALMDPAQICSDVSFVDGAGVVRTGAKDCASVPNCTSDGQVGCKTTSSYKAVDMSVAVPENILSAVTIAGVPGTYTVPSDCTADGATGCKTTATYKSVDMSLVVATNILNGQTVAGQLGSLVAPATCTSSGQQNCVATASNRAATICAAEGSSDCFVPSYAAGTSDLKAVDYNILQSHAGSMRSAANFGGVSGTLVDCSSNGGTGCVATSSYNAVLTSELNPANIKNGVTLGTTAGQYPSAAFPLTSNTATVDLDSTTFEAKMRSSTSFEFWDSSGVKYTASGDPELSMGNIKAAVSIFGVNGSSPVVIVPPWDLRAGFSFNGEVGKLSSNCRNSGNSAYDTNANSSVVDPLETLDDYVFPDLFVFGWSAYSNCRGTETSMDDSNNWKDVTKANDFSTPSTCGTWSTNCTFEDKVTKLQWSKLQAPKSWYEANQNCAYLTHNGMTDWRLPDQKELMQAYVNGIMLTGSSDWTSAAASTSVDYWTATSVMGSQWFNAIVIQLGNGVTSMTPKHSNNYSLCVRP